MNRNLVSLIWSFVLILSVVGAAFLLYRFARISAETTRKIIHIGVSNWVFILANGFDSLAWALAGPACFMVINAVFVYSGFAKYLGMGDRKRDNGLIYYPLSIIVMVLLDYYGAIETHDVIAGTLAMGWGDGLAALVGSKWGRRKYSVGNARKSWLGTCVMFLATYLVMLLFTPYAWWACALVALLSTFFEAVTPLGLDNITVPVFTALAGVVL